MSVLGIRVVLTVIARLRASPENEHRRSRRYVKGTNSRSHHHAGRPPSIMKVAAVTYEASSEASQSMG